MQPQQPAGQDDLGTTALWNKPANVSWGDYMLAHLAKPFQGADQAAQDYSRTAVDTATFGLGDRFQSYLTGNPLEKERAETNAAYGRLGAMAPIVGGAMYAMGPGEVSAAARGAGWLGKGAWGAMTEGAAAGGAGALGHDENPIVGALGGAGLGAAGGLAAKVTNPVIGWAANKAGRVVGALTSPADVTASLEDAKQAAYDKLKEVPVSGVADAVANARDAIEAADPGGALRQNAPRTMAELGRIEGRLGSTQTLSGQDAADWLAGQRANMSPDDYAGAWGQLQRTGSVTIPGERAQSAHDVLTSLDNLRDYQGPTAGAENDLAPIVERHLNDVLDNAGSSRLLDNAEAAHKAYKNAQFLQQAGEGLKFFGQSPAGEAARMAQTYYPGGAADIMAGGARQQTADAQAYQALSDIAKAGGGYQSAYGLMHAVHPLVEDALIGSAGAHVGPALGAAASYMAVKPALGAALNKLQTATTQRALAAGYPALTGAKTAYQPDVSAALRTLLFGGAAGGF